MRIHIGFDFHYRGNCFAHLAEEFQAHGACVFVCAVQDEARRGDDAVAAFLLDAGQARQEFVGDILAQSCLAECAASERLMRKLADATSWILPRLWSSRSTFIHKPSGVTMRHDARLSSAVPHSTAFLPPAFIATLPPMHDASAEVGSTANTRWLASAASITRRVTTPAPQWMVAQGSFRPGRTRCSTAERASSFSVLITAENLSSGTAPPV